MRRPTLPFREAIFAALILASAYTPAACAGPAADPPTATAVVAAPSIPVEAAPTISPEELDAGLITAVAAGDQAQVAALLEAGANPNVRKAREPVLLAAMVEAGRTGDMAIVELLLDHGADVNGVDATGNALLPHAAETGSLELVQRLLDAGIDIDGTRSHGRRTGATALRDAAADNALAMAELLIANGADLEIASRNNDATPLSAAAAHNHVEMVTLLLENGADIESKSDELNGMTPLHAALFLGSVRPVAPLLEAGADVNALTNIGQTPLMTLLINNLAYLKMLNELIEAGASVTIADDFGNTALHHAVRWERAEAIPVLLDAGADLNAVNNKGQTPVDLAMDEALIAILKEAGAGE